MSAPSSPTTLPPRAVFLSYAREDTAAVRRLADALRQAEVEVWFDQNELVGGDAWDAKIRRQIKECALFVPIISAQTQARREGYFRIEWKLAAQRTHAIADGTPFLVPVTLDGTGEGGALVPEEFRGVQWTRLETDAAYAAFCTRIQRLVTGVVGVTAEGREAPQRPASGAKAGRSSDGSFRKVWLGLALAGFAAVAAVWYGLRPQKQGTGPAAAVAPAGSGLAEQPETQSVAVLAFENKSDDKDNEYFSDGISEELLTVLQQVPGLRVAAKISSFSFKGKSATAQEIGEKLKVAHLVEGSVQKLGNTVKITARLSRAATGDHIWAYSDTRELKDIFALQNEIAELIAKNLQVKLGAMPRVAKEVNPAAHRLVLEGRHYWNLRTNESFTQAEGAFQKALAIDPRFAEAHAGLATVFVVRSNYDQLDDLSDGVTDIQRSRAAAARALELDESMVEAHAALGFGYLLDRRFAESERSFRRALALNPNSAVTHCWYGLHEIVQGRLVRAEEEFQRAALLDPLWYINAQMVANRLLASSRIAEAWEANERAAQLWPGTYGVNRGYAVAIAHELGRTDTAVKLARELRQSTSPTPRWWTDAFAVYALRQAGQTEEAAEYARWAMAKFRPDSYMRGWLLAAEGRYEESLRYLRRTPTVGWSLIYALPMWEPLRRDSRFQQMVEQLGHAEQYRVTRETLSKLTREESLRGRRSERE